MVHSDIKISKKEEDLLNRYPFAEQIVKELILSFKTGQDSITVGINGEWGYGKSSFIEFIKNEIEIQTADEPAKKFVFEFNPWLFSGQTDLQKSFLTQLGLKLRTLNGELPKLGQDIITIISALEVANVVNPDPTSKKLAKGGARFIKKMIERVTSFPTLEKLKSQIDNLLEESHFKLFIVLDDIDRLIPQEIAQIFRMVVLNANFKNTFFIMAYDKDIVSKALSDEFHLEGEKYLEKIIQLDYSLPVIPKERLHYIFLKLLEKSIDEKSFTIHQNEINRIWDKGFGEYFSTIRNIYRFFNSFNLRQNAITNDTHLVDFIGIEAIRLFDTVAFNWIQKERKRLVYSPSPFSQPDFEFQENFDLYEFIKSSETLSGKQDAIDLIFFLFKGNHVSEFSFDKTEIDNEKIENEKRIAHIDYFEHYFTFTISKNNIKESIIKKYLNGDDETKYEVLEEYYQNNLRLFLKKVFFLIEDKEQLDVQKHLLDFCDEKHLYISANDISGRSGWSSIVEYLNEISEKCDHESYLNEILIRTESYSRFLLQAFLKNRVDGLDNIDPVKGFSKELIVKNLVRIETVFKKSLGYFSQKYLNDPLDMEVELIHTVLSWLHKMDKDEYMKRIDEFLSDTERSLILLRCSFTVVTSGKVSYQLQKDKHILKDLTIEQLDDALGSIVPDQYTGKNKKYLEIFHKLKENKFRPNLSYTLDLEEINF
jgi:hypothetical protein